MWFIFVFSLCFIPFLITHQYSLPGGKQEKVTKQNVTSILPLLHHGNKSYYMGIQMKLNFLQAMQFCENIGMQLLTIDSDEENKVIYKHIREANKGDEYWSSGSRFIDGKTWIWMIDSKRIGFTKWATGEPNSPVDQCLLLVQQKNVGLFWSDRDCNLQFWFICQKKFEAEGDNLNTRISGLSDPTDSSLLWPNIKLLHFKNKSYYFSRQFKGTFLQAVEFCRMIKMRLVTITSEEENKRLYKYIRDTIAGDNWWTSGTRMLDGERWFWMSTGEEVEYTNWLTGQPDTMTDLCLHLLHQRNNGLFWNDANCNNQYQVICETNNPDYEDNDRTSFENGTDNEDDEVVREVRRSFPGPLRLLYQGKTFHIETGRKVTQSQATQYCEYHNMRLLNVDGEREVDDIRRVLASSDMTSTFWTANTVKSFNNNKQQGLNLNRRCLAINKYGNPQDESCERKHDFICEMPKAFSLNPQPEINVYVNSNVYVSSNISEEDETVRKIFERFFSPRNADVTTSREYSLQPNTTVLQVAVDDNPPENPKDE